MSVSPSTVDPNSPKSYLTAGNDDYTIYLGSYLLKNNNNVAALASGSLKCTSGVDCACPDCHYIKIGAVVMGDGIPVGTKVVAHTPGDGSSVLTLSRPATVSGNPTLTFALATLHGLDGSEYGGGNGVLVDLDGDGDGDFVSYPRYFENVGNKASAAYVERPRTQATAPSASRNPFRYNPMVNAATHNDLWGVPGASAEFGGGYHNFARVTVFVDTDGDGDLDMLWQKFDGSQTDQAEQELRHFENTGTRTNPLFVTQDTKIAAIYGRFGAAVVDGSGLLNILVTSRRRGTHSFDRAGALFFNRSFFSCFVFSFLFADRRVCFSPLPLFFCLFSGAFLTKAR